jgi:hypothetical protein
MVPPLTPPFIDATCSTVSVSSPLPVGPRLLRRQQHAEVGGDRVEAAGVHDARTRRGRGVVPRSIDFRMNSTSPVRSQ